MLITGVVIGFLISILSGLAFCYLLKWLVGPSVNDTLIPKVFQRKPEKKKPKFVSDEEQWKKEQRQAPLDPTYNS